MFCITTSELQHLLCSHGNDYESSKSNNKINTIAQELQINDISKIIEAIHSQDNRFNLDRGSWTSDRNWVKGYESVLTPINQLSAVFHREFDGKKINKNDRQYRTALLYLLLSQTSCFRYWGEGMWTEYAKELCRRGLQSLGAC